VGKNRSTVANSLRLLKLPQDMIEALRDDSLTPGHARAVLAVLNPADQEILFKRIRGDGLSVRQAEEMSKQLNAGQRNAGKAGASPSTDRAKPFLPPEIRDIEQRMIDALGTKVSVGGNGKKGRIVIDYYSTEDLERVLEIVSGK
jgi:ParB family chromosome partitioning protein